MEGADFSGYATKAGLKCSDGRTITAEAFKHMDGKQVPLVWQHSHTDPENVLGHAILKAMPDGVYAYGFFNDTPAAKHARTLVQHKDINSLSIFANNLVERGQQVFHGIIRELSLVLSGANPGALIDHIAHGDYVADDEAIIYTGLALQHSDGGSPEKTEAGENEELDAQKVYDSMSEDQKAVVHSMLGAALEVSGEAEEVAVHAANENRTVKDVYDSFTEEQKNVVHYMIGAALEAAAESNSAAQSGITNTESDPALSHQEGNDMSRNVFEQNGLGAKEGPSLSHDDLKSIVENAQKLGSFKEAFLAHAQTYGIVDIDVLFPDAKSLSSQPELLARRAEWVRKVLDGAKHSPFARVKSVVADLTAEEARAKGYVKGNLKKEEIIRLLKRVTLPTTVYKKQKLDRDDIIDITDLDVVAWLKWEMRFMLEEELARAILVGDGREPDAEDKIDEDMLRPIAWDDPMYAHPVTLATNTTTDGVIEAIIRARKNYKGTGSPTLYTTDDILVDMFLTKDRVGRRMYNTEAELAAALRVKDIVTVEVMEDHPDLLAIIVNLTDYTIGADKGGETSMFDDFDIDYNQYKYLIETRISGALTKPKSAVVVKRTSGTTVTPTAPAFNPATNTLTVPTIAGVAYFNVTDPMNEVALADGANVVITQTSDVEARPEAGYNFPHNTDNDWTFAYTA